MSYRTLALLAFASSGSALSCQAEGVSLGAEEPCQADPALEAAALSSRLNAAQGEGAWQISNCSRIGENILLDPSFEAPTATCNDDLYCQFDADEVDGWETSSAERVIEVWRDQYMGIPSPDGSQFVELNANARDTLFQDVRLPPGQLVYWSFRHRGRVNIESVEVLLGSLEAPVSQGTFGSGAEAWVTHQGLYRTPQTAGLTRFSLGSRSGAREANLIDAAVLAPVD